eukprot:m.265107 g.265107  ORF g.265107 m.265107 type:complete len:130 (+) comp28575_c0_seq1:195-584(+)
MTTKNQIHQNTILNETVAKEIRNQKLYTSFQINPHSKPAAVAGKPNVADLDNSDDDDEILKTLAAARKPPKQKSSFPMTSSQEYGWDTAPLISSSTGNFSHPRKQTEITNYMDAYWKQKEQQTMQQPPK